MNIDIVLLEKIKKIVIISLVEDDFLLDNLVLKGGNAINMIYNLSNRSSLDLDYSISNEFDAEELEFVQNKIQELLTKNFKDNELTLFDYSFEVKPKTISDSIKDFWGGYRIEFKLLAYDVYEKKKDDIDDLRRNAIPLTSEGSPKYIIDISKYEFCEGKIQRNMEGLILFAYTPEMIVIEKLRAICQQMPEYREVVPIPIKSRARDFFDISILVEHFKIDLNTRENIELIKNIFDAKRVPLSYLLNLAKIKEIQSLGFESVKQTVSKSEDLKDFEYYYTYVNKLIKELPLLDPFRVK